MKILLTGSSGFIGSHISPILVNNFELFHLKSDLKNYVLVQNEVKDISPDIIIHLAARTEVEKSFYEQTEFSEVNYVGTVNLIEAATTIKNLKNFIFASTMEVYGWQPISDEVKINKIPKNFISFDENTQPNPNAPYAVAKYACEKYLQYAQRSMGLPYTIIRQTNSYGRKDNNFFVTEQIITQMLANKKEINLGYGEPYRNFLYIDDLLNAWTTIITSYELVNKGYILTLGPDNPIKIKDYANTIAKKLNWSGKINWNTKPKRPGEIYYLNSNHNLITNLVGWKPTISLDEGLVRTIKVWKDRNL